MWPEQWGSQVSLGPTNARNLHFWNYYFFFLATNLGRGLTLSWKYVNIVNVFGASAWCGQGQREEMVMVDRSVKRNREDPS